MGNVKTDGKGSGCLNTDRKVFRLIDQSDWMLLEFVAADKGVLGVVYNSYGTIKAFPISELLIRN